MELQAQTVGRAEVKRPGKRWKRRLRRAIVWTVVLAIVGGAAALGIGALKQEYTTTYDGYTASTGSISNALSFSGSLGLVKSATYTATGAATVREVRVQAGDEVQAGALLMRLSSGQRVTAEFAGRVNAVPVAVGDEVSSGASLVQVADFSRMKVAVRVDEYDISQVSVGQKCTVTTTATESVFDSEIAAIDYISASTGSVAYYTATAYVDATDGVYPGMQATVTVPQEEATNVVVLKMDALSFDDANNAFVYVQDAAGAMTAQYVGVGVSNGNYVEITSGLQSGQQVFVEAAQTASESGVSGLLSGLFGQQRVNAGGGGGTRTRDTSTMPDFSNFTPDSGSMPGGMTRPGAGQ